MEAKGGLVVIEQIKNIKNELYGIYAGSGNPVNGMNTVIDTITLMSGSGRLN